MHDRVFSGYELRKLHLAARKNILLPDIKIRNISASKIKLKIAMNQYSLFLPKKHARSINPMLRKLKALGKVSRVVGIDLTGSEKRASGWAILEKSNADVKLINLDKELIKETIKVKPEIISIDSPLSVPGGGAFLKANPNGKEFGIMRHCERVLRRRSVYVYPCLLPSMKGLTRRGMMLAKKFRKLGFEVIESYPGAAQDILGIIRKRIDIEELKQGLIDFGIKGKFVNKKSNHDELDAITSALVGYFYLVNSYEGLGNKQEGYLIVPKSRNSGDKNGC